MKRAPGTACSTKTTQEDNDGVPPRAGFDMGNTTIDVQLELQQCDNFSALLRSLTASLESSSGSAADDGMMRRLPMVLELYRECLHRETWVTEHAVIIQDISDAIMGALVADEDSDLVQEALSGKQPFDFCPVAELLAQALASEMLHIADDRDAFLYVKRKEEEHAPAEPVVEQNTVVKRNVLTKQDLFRPARVGVISFRSEYKLKALERIKTDLRSA